MFNPFRKSPAPVVSAPKQRPAPSLEERANAANAEAGYAFDLMEKARVAFSSASEVRDAVAAEATNESLRLLTLAETQQDEAEIEAGLADRLGYLGNAA